MAYEVIMVYHLHMPFSLLDIYQSTYLSLIFIYNIIINLFVFYDIIFICRLISTLG